MIEVKSKKFLLFLKLKKIEIIQKNKKRYIDVKIEEYEKLLREFREVVSEL